MKTIPIVVAAIILMSLPAKAKDLKELMAFLDSIQGTPGQIQDILTFVIEGNENSTIVFFSNKGGYSKSFSNIVPLVLPKCGINSPVEVEYDAGGGYYHKWCDNDVVAYLDIYKYRNGGLNYYNTVDVACSFVPFRPPLCD